MDASDPRHGTLAGYGAGCHDTCCLTAKRAYDKRLELDRLNGHTRTRPNTGASRRLRALATLGWSAGALANELDAVQQEVIRWRSGHYETIRTPTHDRIAAAYERLCMTPPPAATPSERSAAERARQHAANKGWAPPLAWDDIDNPDETPAGAYIPRGYHANRDGTLYDEAVVIRILNGDWRLPCSPADKAEVVARWNQRDPLADRGWRQDDPWDAPSYNYLERLTGWRVDRYKDGAA